MLLVSILLFETSCAKAVELQAIAVAGHHLTICRIDPKSDHLALFLDDETGDKLKSFSALQAFVQRKGRTLLFAMNAGMFQPGFSPLGLFVSSEKQLTPLNLDRGAGNFFMQPNGVFFLSSSGSAHVVTSQEFLSLHEKPLLATQSGPMLVHDGKINSNFNPASTSRLYRNGVGVTTAGEAIFAIADDPMNFYEFAAVFRDTLHCANALILDGTISSLYAPPLHRNDHEVDLGPMIGVIK